jgi:hypothetical protein
MLLLLMKEVKKAMNNEYKRCPICTQWMRRHEKLFNILICGACGHKEIGRMNSTIEPAKEKRGFIVSAWDRIGGRL